MNSTLKGILTYVYDQVTHRSDSEQLANEATSKVNSCQVSSTDSSDCPDFFTAYLRQRKLTDEIRQMSPALWRPRQ